VEGSRAHGMLHPSLQRAGHPEMSRAANAHVGRGDVTPSGHSTFVFAAAPRRLAFSPHTMHADTLFFISLSAC